MPIYEYRCPKCGTFETMQRITEPALKRCPTCKSKVERMISSSSFVLKGSGWYATDFAKKGPSPPDTSSASNGTNGNASASESSKPSAEKGASSSEAKTPASS